MPTPRFWKPSVRQIVDGEEVNALVANRAIQDQSSREDYLYNAIQSLSLSSGRLIRANVPVSDDTVINDIVYYDTDNDRFAPALAEVVYDSGVAVSSRRSFAVGMALSVSSGFANILLFGHVLIGGEEGEYMIDPLELLDSQESSFIEGVYYLSRKQAGKISRVPAAPVVQLGYFGNDGFTFVPVYKDLLESHFHHSFDLFARPAASQNYDLTGWHQFAGDADLVKYIDCFNRNTDTAPPPIITTIRWTGSFEPSAVRIDIFRSSATEYSAELTSGAGLDYSDPQSVGADTTVLPAEEWPEYGEYVAIGDTGLEVAFLRRDADYTNTLTVDAAALLAINTDRFKIYLPNDLEGWTNANPFDLTTPSGVFYRYLVEGQPSLAITFPPLPLESAILENNGIGLKSGDDFLIDLAGVWWIPSDVAAPWPVDFIADGTDMEAANARNLRLHFSKVTAANSNGGVHSLKSLSDALVITRCPTGEEAEEGPLQIYLNLGLSVDTELTENRDVILVGVEDQKFLVGPVVTELVAGPGIRLVRESESSIPGARFTGRIRVERKDVNLEGEVSSIALVNAKEVKREFYAYVAFPTPASTRSGVIASFKLPETGLSPATLKLHTQALGGVSSATSKTAIFKLVYQAMRPGFSLADLAESTALSVQYWTVSFPVSYAAFTVLDPELPDTDSYAITTSSILAESVLAGRAPSPVLPDGLEDGDMIAVTITRVVANADGLTDDYPGDVGFTGLRWAITIP